MPKPKPVYALVQQGGSSKEMYLHVHDTRAQAKIDKAACAKASYQTSEIFAIPGEVANEQTYTLIEAGIEAALSLL